MRIISVLIRSLLILMCCASAYAATKCESEKYFMPEDYSGTKYEKPSKEFIAERQRARQGDAGAQYNLGVYYENGFFVTPCREKAKFWYSKAAANGNAQAATSMALLKCEERLFPDPTHIGLFTLDMCNDPQLRNSNTPTATNAAPAPNAYAAPPQAASYGSADTASKEKLEDGCPAGIFNAVCRADMRQRQKELDRLDRALATENRDYERKKAILEKCMRDGITRADQCPVY